MRERMLLFVLDRRARIIALVSSVFFLSLIAKFSFSLIADDMKLPPLLDDLIDSIITAMLASWISYVFLHTARSRRQEVLVQIRKIAELNHHVRNCLQVILGAEALRQAPAKEVLESVHRIDTTLKRLYPVVDQRLVKREEIMRASNGR
jgi:hypothetical protein